MAAPGPTAAEWLDLIVDRAPRLRELGVTVVEFRGCSVTIAPAELAAAAAAPNGKADVQRERELDPLFDPATYADGKVPGFKIDDLALDGDLEGRS